MREIEFPEANIRLYVPSCLAECNQQEYEAAATSLMAYYSGEVLYEDFKVRLTAKLINYQFSSKKPNEDALANLVYISQIIDDFFEETDGNKSVKLDFIDQKIPVIKIGFKRFYGPGDAFDKLTYGQYADASRIFQEYNRDKSKELLYVLLAMLYVPKKGYSSEKVEQTGELFKKHINAGIAFAVFLQFAAFQKYISSAEIDWRGNTLDLSILFDDNETQETIPGLGIESLIFTLAESNVFGSEDSVRKTNFWKVMLRMYDLRKRDLETQKTEQNANNK